MMSLLRLDRAKFRYLCVTALSFVGNLALTFCLVEFLGVAPGPAYAISLVAIFLSNFHLVRYWVYPERVADRSWGQQFAPFLVASLVFRGSEWLAYLILIDWLEVFYLLAVVVVQVTFFIAKYFLYDRVIFNPRRSPPA